MYKLNTTTCVCARVCVCTLYSLSLALSLSLLLFVKPTCNQCCLQDLYIAIEIIKEPFLRYYFSNSFMKQLC